MAETSVKACITISHKPQSDHSMTKSDTANETWDLDFSGFHAFPLSNRTETPHETCSPNKPGLSSAWVKSLCKSHVSESRLFVRTDLFVFGSWRRASVCEVIAPCVLLLVSSTDQCNPCTLRLPFIDLLFVFHVNTFSSFLFSVFPSRSFIS